MKNKRFVTVWLSIVFFRATLLAEGNGEKPVYVKQTFRSNAIINSPSTEILTPDKWQFTMQHRFGVNDWDKKPWNDLFGLDNASRIRIGFVFPLGKAMNVGVGRSNYMKTFDFDIKAVLLRQTDDNHFPVTVAFATQALVSAADFPETNNQYFESDSSTHFQYQFSHRLAYTSQLLLARKWNNRITTQVACLYVHKNLVEQDEYNQTMVWPVAIRLKTTMTSNLLLEYSPQLRKPQHGEHHVSLAYEITSANHIFQLVASSSGFLLAPDMYYAPSSEYWKGDFYLGFNIKKLIYRKRFLN